MRLGDVCSIRYGKDHKKLSDGDIPVYGSGGIMRHVDKAIWDKPSVLIPRKGTLGNLFFVDKPFWTVDTLFWTDIDQSKVMPRFLYYALKTKNLAELNVGTAVPSLTTDVLNEVEVDIPDLDLQESIVSLLQAFDSTINVNSLTNDYLAAIAEGIFENWLLAAEGDSVPLSHIASFNPSTYATKEKWPTVVYVDTGSVTLNHFEDPIIIDTATEKLPSRARRKVESGDVIYSTVRPNQLHYGLMNNPPSNMLVSTGFTVVRDKTGVGGPFVYLALTRPSITTMLQSVAEQSTSAYPSIKSSDLEQIEIPEPTKEELDEIKPQLDSLFELIAQNERESRALGELRDTLLPKLMSGEIDVLQIGS